MMGPLIGWAGHLAREAVRGARDCGRARPLHECGVLASCCRPEVSPIRYDYRNALAAVNGHQAAGGPWLHARREG